MKKILVIDIGGTHVKLMLSRRQKRKFDSGAAMTPKEFVAKTTATVQGWKFDAIAIGFPAPVKKGKIAGNPKHLGKGWAGFDFNKSLGKPTRVINDASMQALGSYKGGRMLFLGLGTGLGSALLWEKNVLPLELGDLPYEGGIIENILGKPGLEKLGRKEWQREVFFCIELLKKSFIADYVVLGGGNAKALTEIPKGFVLGHNRNAYLGGCRLWQTEAGSRRAKWNILS